MKYIAISDLHIGSRFCFRDELLNFIGHLPVDTGLILNGDSVDFFPDYTEKDHILLKLISSESLRREVIWVKGNHDNQYKPPGENRIKFVSSFIANNRVLIAHGDSFEDRRLLVQCFVITFRFFYKLHLRLGAKPIHVAAYAKKFPSLYKSFREKVSSTAMAVAREKGLDTVICGHTHFVEDITVNGIRCINTGSWTEKPFCYAEIGDDVAVRKIA